MLRRVLYRIYFWGSGLTLRGQRRFTPAGWLVLSALAVSAFLGFDTLFSMTYQAIVFLGALLGLSLTWSVWSPGHYSGVRLLPRYGTAGQPMPYRIRLCNKTRQVQRSLTAAEQLADPRPSPESFRDIAEPGESRRNRFDRFFAYYRWRWLLDRNRGARTAPRPVPDLAPGKEVELSMTLWPQRRGVLRLSGLAVSWPDPFGLCWGRCVVPAAASVVILPKRYAIPRFALPGSQQYQPGGVALARAVGESEEFIGMRDYRVGDPLRHIHWRSWAKASRPIVKEYQDEFFVRHALILDTFRAEGEDELFEEAVAVAASFGCTVEEQDSLLDLLFVGEQAIVFTTGRGLAHPEQLLEVLAGVPACRHRPFTVLENLVLEHAVLVSGAVGIFLSWDEDRRRLVRHLESMGKPVEVFVLLPRGSGPDQKGPTGLAAAVDFPERFHCLELGRVQQQLRQL